MEEDIKFEFLSKLVKIINSTLDLNEILNFVVSFMKNSLNAKACSILIFSGNNKGYTIEKMISSLENNVLKEIDYFLAKKNFNQKGVIRIRNISDINMRFKNSFFSSVISIPLNVRGNVIGLMNLYGDSLEKIKETDVKLINIISDHVSIAISNAKHHELIKELSLKDPLTELYTRRYFMEFLEKELARGERLNESLSVILLDLDNFKSYNDVYGHVAGDSAIKTVANILKNNVRKMDIVGRYGGEEFIVILPNTNQEGALEVAEKIREGISSNQFKPAFDITASIGLITCIDKKLSVNELLKDVDKNLYEAKNSGKNKVTASIRINESIKVPFVN